MDEENLENSTMDSHNQNEAEKELQPHNDVMDDLRYVPKDKGWAWMCVISGFIMNVLVVGCAAKSFGILFVEIVEKFGSSSAATSWISSLNQCLGLTLGPVASTLAVHFGTRWVVMTAGLLITTGFILSMFAVSLEYYYFSYGLIVGIGSALAYTPTIVLIGLYFDKRRSLANGLTVAGSGVGSFVFPPFIQWLLDLFGLENTLLLMAAFMLNICVCGALLRPLSFYSPQKSKPKSTCMSLFKETKFDWSLLRVPEFLVYGLSLFLCFCGYPNLFIMIPPHCKNVGFSKHEAALIVSVIGILDLVGRVFFGWFSDLQCVSKRGVYMSSMAISGLACMLIPLMHSFLALAFMSAIFGLFAGCYVALLSPILAETLGAHRLPSAFGLAMMCQGLAFLFSPPLVGLMEDQTGSWTASFIFSGISMLLGAGVPLLLPLIHRARSKSKLKQSSVDLHKIELDINPIS